MYLAAMGLGRDAASVEPPGYAAAQVVGGKGQGGKERMERGEGGKARQVIA